MHGLQWYPRYVGDYARKTKHLTMLEHGAYNMLLDHYYATGKPLLFSNATSNAGSNGELMPDHSRLYRLCGAINKAEQDAVDSVLEMFFQLTENGYINKKAAETIEKQRAAHERRVNAGRKGGKQSSSNAGSNAKAKLKQPEPEPEPNIYNTLSNERVTLPTSLLMSDGRQLSPDRFTDELWDLYPSIGRRKGHKTKFKEQIYKALKKGTNHEEIRNGVNNYAKYCNQTGELNKDAQRWARDREWELDYKISTPDHRPQQRHNGSQGTSSLSQIIDAGEKAKEALQRRDAQGT